jgi:uncharacterized membrane protein
MDRDHLIPILLAAFGIVVANVGLVVTSGRVGTVGALIAGIAVFIAGYGWYRRRKRHTEDVAFDERIAQVTYRSGELAFRLSLGLGALLFVVLDVEGVPLTAREGLAVLLVGMVIARFGLYEYYRRQTV